MATDADERCDPMRVHNDLPKPATILKDQLNSNSALRRALYGIEHMMASRGCPVPDPTIHARGRRIQTPDLDIFPTALCAPPNIQRDSLRALMTRSLTMENQLYMGGGLLGGHCCLDCRPGTGFRASDTVIVTT